MDKECSKLMSGSISFSKPTSAYLLGNEGEGFRGMGGVSFSLGLGHRREPTHGDENLQEKYMLKLERTVLA